MQQSFANSRVQVGDTIGQHVPHRKEHDGIRRCPIIVTNTALLAGIWEDIKVMFYLRCVQVPDRIPYSCQPRAPLRYTEYGVYGGFTEYG